MAWRNEVYESFPSVTTYYRLVNGVVTFQYSYNQGTLARRSYRSLPTSGGPLGGFRLPTSYYAHFWTAHGDPYDITYDLGGGATRRFVGVGCGSEAGGILMGLKGTTQHPVPDVPAYLVDRANSEALAALDSSGLDLAESMLDARQTAELIASTMISVIKAYKAVRRGNPKAAVKELVASPRLSRGIKSRLKSHHVNRARRPDQGWLELQYGWLPLLSDIYALCEALRHNWSISLPMVYVTAVATNKFRPSGERLHSATGNVEIGAEVKLWYRITDPGLHMLSSLGLTNPASMAWEALPYSFVIDWFLPVNNFLEGFTATQGLEFVTGYRTEFAKANCSVKYELRYSYNNFIGNLDIQGNEYPTLHFRHKSMRRYRLTSFPSSKPYFKLGFTTNRVTSAIALYTSARRL